MNPLRILRVAFDGQLKWSLNSIIVPSVSPCCFLSLKLTPEWVIVTWTG